MKKNLKIILGITGIIILIYSGSLLLGIKETVSTQSEPVAGLIGGASVLFFGIVGGFFGLVIMMIAYLFLLRGKITKQTVKRKK